VCAHIGWPRDDTVYYRPAYSAATRIGAEQCAMRRLMVSTAPYARPALAILMAPFHLPIACQDGISRARDTGANGPARLRTPVQSRIRNKKCRPIRGAFVMFSGTRRNPRMPGGPGRIRTPTRPVMNEVLKHQDSFPIARRDRRLRYDVIRRPYGL